MTKPDLMWMLPDDWARLSPAEKEALRPNGYVAPAVVTGDGRPTRLQLEDSDPPIALLTFPRGIVRVTNSDLYIWSRVRDSHRAELKAGTGWAPASRREWEELVGELETAMEQDPKGRVPAPPERTFHGRVAALLADLWDRHGDGRPTQRMGVYVDDDSTEWLCFHFGDLVRANADDSRNSVGVDRERMLRHQLQVGVERQIGGEPPGRVGVERGDWSLFPLGRMELRLWP